MDEKQEEMSYELELMKSADMYGVPPHIIGGFTNYIMRGLMPGGFCTAVLDNDLYLALNRADGSSYASLRQIAKWLYENAPAECCGDSDKVSRWNEVGGWIGRRAILAEKALTDSDTC